MASNDGDEDHALQRKLQKLEHPPPQRNQNDDDSSESGMEDVMAAHQKKQEAQDRQKETDAAVRLALSQQSQLSQQTLTGFSQVLASAQGLAFSNFHQPPVVHHPRPTFAAVTATAVTTTDVAKKAPAKKKRSEPSELATVTCDLAKKRIAIAEEFDSKNKKDPGPHRVAAKLTTGSEARNNLKVWVLDDLRSEQLWELATNFGCRKVGSAMKFECQKTIACKMDMGEMCDNLEGPHPSRGPDDFEIGSLMRIINAAFLPENVNSLIELNDTKKLKESEEAGGGSPVTVFWHNMSEIVSDPEMNDRIGKVCFAWENQDARLHDFAKDNLVNLNDFTPGTDKTCQKHFSDVMKARQNILKLKKTFGTHEPDTHAHCNTKHLKLGKQPESPKIQVHCLDKMCREHPSIDSAHATLLAKKLKSDSTKPPEDDDKEKKKPKDLMFDTVADTMAKMATFHEDSKVHCEKILAVHLDKEKNRDWGEHADLCNHVAAVPVTNAILLLSHPIH